MYSRGEVSFQLNFTYLQQTHSFLPSDYFETVYEYSKYFGSYVPTFSYSFKRTCAFVAVPAREVRRRCSLFYDLVTMLISMQHRLNNYIGGQDEALKAIVSNVASWEMRRKSGQPEPLVLAFTGPSGVGKSESAYRMSQALFTQVVDDKPCGLLVLRGEDYSDNAEIIQQNNGISEARKQIRDQICEHLNITGGEAMIVFDEVQKVSPGVLEVFLPALDKHGFFTRSFIDSRTGISHTHHCTTSHAIFIFISDIGNEELRDAVLQYGDRDLIDMIYFRNEVRMLMDEQWTRLNFGKTIKDVIPFMPLEPSHIWSILQKQVHLFSEGNRGKYWLKLVFDDQVIDHLAVSDMYKYETITAEVTSAVVDDEADDSNDDSINDSNNDTIKTTTRTVTKNFAKWGARAGPLPLLEGAIEDHMQPWRTGQLLHVGMFTPAIAKSSYCKGTKAVDVYLQWCKPKPYMLASCQMTNSNIDQLSSEAVCKNVNSMPVTSYIKEDLVISEDVALSSVCGPLICVQLQS